MFFVITKKVAYAGVVPPSYSVEAHNRWDLRVSTGRLNRWLAAMDRHHPPPTVKGKQLKVKYMTQVKARPPTFAVFVNRPEDVPETYRRFLLNQLRTEFDMTGVPAVRK
uniref:GTPase Der C-terminal KH-domain-like domain-containing protein n=1 Tax=Hucho hucho TaxID=62062 RepID=A0A4W5M241_9TELE